MNMSMHRLDIGPRRENQYSQDHCGDLKGASNWVIKQMAHYDIDGHKAHNSYTGSHTEIANYIAESIGNSG